MCIHVAIKSMATLMQYIDADINSGGNCKQVRKHRTICTDSKTSLVAHYVRLGASYDCFRPYLTTITIKAVKFPCRF